MTVDPTDPDAFGPDDHPGIEDLTGTVTADAGEDSGDIGTETPEGDAAEQRVEVDPDTDTEEPVDLDTAEADEADALDQAKAVTLDEDEYR